MKIYIKKNIILSLIISIIIISFFYFTNKCKKCMDGNKDSIFKYKNCPAELIFNGLNIISADNTLNEIIFNNKSISRFGDGEFNLMFGKSLRFQDFNKSLCNRLLNIFNSNDSGILIGINIHYNIEDLKKYTEEARKYYIQWTDKFKIKLAKLINKKKVYYSSEITRFYIDHKNKTGVKEYIKKVKQIWENRDIVIIEGENSKLGIGNDLFNNTKSIKRIICPSENAFIVYEKIIKEASKINKNNLILIALGPTATLLSYDLYKIGYQAIDVGHIDIEYEWFLRNATKKCKIENKSVYEVLGKRDNYKNVTDKNYYQQIIKKILY